jgi:phosphopantetheine--protein transferase-like protein
MIGIDIFNINRLKNKSKSFIEKVFSQREIAETKANNIHEKLAGKWAAKEAAYKAGILKINKEIEILTINKKPSILIDGKNIDCMISISHDGDYATAIVFKNV